MDSISKDTLQRLEGNDPSLRSLEIGPRIISFGISRSCGIGVFDVTRNRSIIDLARLGESIAKHTHVQSLTFLGSDGFTICSLDVLLEHIRRNTSINSIHIRDMLAYSEDMEPDASDLLTAIGDVCSGIFTSNIRVLQVIDSDLTSSGTHALASTITKCTGLRAIHLTSVFIDDDGFSELCEALGGLYYLGILELIMDGGLITPIGASGCNAVADLLKQEKSNLHTLNISCNGIDDDGAIAIAHSLTTNKRLRRLNLSSNQIGPVGWNEFARVLCNVESPNKTYLSNHTLQTITYNAGLPSNLSSYLALNRSSKGTNAIATKKILLSHSNFDMEPLFQEWELKCLPLVVDWFNCARAVVDRVEDVERRKLSAIYQFAKFMPLVFVAQKKARRGKRTRYQPTSKC